MDLLKNNSLDMEIKKMRKFLKKDKTILYAMGKEAHHLLGEISREKWDLISIDQEDEDNYYGSWVYGYGFIDIRFPKKSIKALNKKEIKKYEGSAWGISGNYMGKLEVKDMLWKKPQSFQEFF